MGFPVILHYVSDKISSCLLLNSTFGSVESLKCSPFSLNFLSSGGVFVFLNEQQLSCVIGGVFLKAPPTYPAAASTFI